MKGIYVNQLSAHGVPYADLIVKGIKTIETRSRNMLSACVGERVAIVRTIRGKKPEVVGYANIYAHEKSKDRASDVIETYVPHGSQYCDNRHFYHLSLACECKPYPLPANAVRHGRSWCEFNKE